MGNEASVIIGRDMYVAAVLIKEDTKVNLVAG